MVQIDHHPFRRRIPALYERGKLSWFLHVENINAWIQDDWYEGYFIPKGTLCLANVWYGVINDTLTCITLIGICRSLNRDRSVYVSRAYGHPRSYQCEVSPRVTTRTISIRTASSMRMGGCPPLQRRLTMVRMPLSRSVLNN